MVVSSVEDCVLRGVGTVRSFLQLPLCNSIIAGSPPLLLVLIPDIRQTCSLDPYVLIASPHVMCRLAVAKAGLGELAEAEVAAREADRSAVVCCVLPAIKKNRNLPKDKEKTTLEKGGRSILVGS